MTFMMNDFLKNKAINEWRLFWLISAPISIIMIIAMLQIDSWSGPSVSSMIQLSVRSAVPWLFIAMSASSLQLLFPGVFSRWLLRNRKIIGLIFASAMAWQLFFILWLVTIYNEYYIGEVYVLRDAIEGVVGYLFLIAMVLTSFNFGRKRLKPKSWRLLHKSGIYFLWAYAFSVYWWALFYYPNPVGIDYVYYWTGFLAWSLRAAAWRKKRWMRAEKTSPGVQVQAEFSLMGYAFIAFGVLAASFGSVWREPVQELITGYAITHLPEKYLPYWPFEPFLSLFIIAFGVYLTTKFRARLKGKLEKK
jgi:DMSO/TMAO reductase YedYZ heme-binding membrane subunit